MTTSQSGFSSHIFFMGEERGARTVMDHSVIKLPPKMPLSLEFILVVEKVLNLVHENSKIFDLNVLCRSYENMITVIVLIMGHNSCMGYY